MQKRWRWMLLTLMWLGLLLGSVTVAAKTAGNCVLKIDGETSASIKAGQAEISFAFAAEKATDTMAVAAVYRDDVLVNVSTKKQDLSSGTNTVTLKNLTLCAEDAQLRVLLLDRNTLAPLMEPVIFEPPEPVLESFSVTLGTRTYAANIDQNKGTVELNVPVYYIRNNTEVAQISSSGNSVYTGTPSEAEYLEQRKEAEPQVTCSAGATVTEESAVLDLSRTQTLTVRNTAGKERTYTLSAQTMTVQRDVDFKKATVMITPETTTYNAGASAIRHNTPLNGASIGSGVWQMEGFAYKEEKENGVYVRTDDSAGENVLTEGGMRMTKDREGVLTLYSYLGNSPQSRVGKTVTKAVLTVESLTGDGMDIALGENRFTLRIVPNTDGSTCSLLLGLQDSFADTGADIAMGEKAELECVVQELGNQQSRAALYLNGEWAYTAQGEVLKSYKLNRFHTSFSLAANTRAKILFDSYQIAYATVPVELNQPYTVTAVTASEDDGNVPANVLDRDYDTRWSAESNGASITLELDAVRPVSYVGIAAYKGNERQTTVSVQVSEDGKTWNEVVTRWVSSLTLDMESIDLGGTYNAKYVRLLGYGNTVNKWNSYTEVSVYGLYDGEGMPVATDGPDSITVVEDFTKEQQKRLTEFDRLFDRLYLWLANLYDQKTGGFYMAKSGADDPEQEPGLEMTFFALSAVSGYSDCWSEMPDTVKQRFIDFIIERQDSETGLFIDKQGPVNERETARNQSCVMGWVKRWEIALPYVHPSQKTTEALTLSADAETEDATVLPDYLESVDSYIAWVESWNWDTNSWTAGDQTQQSLNYLSYLEDSESEAYKTALLDWLEERQFDNGLWAPTVNFNSISGAFKVGLVYNSLGKKLPNPEKIMESTILCMQTDQPTAAHHVRNPLSLLSQISGDGISYAKRIEEATGENMDVIIDWVETFLCPDGGFSMNYKKSMGTFGGIKGSHQLWEGDVDSTLMILIARNAVYSLMGSSAPKIHAPEDFWQWIAGTKEVPSPYIDAKYDIDVENYQKPDVSQNFESFTANTTLKGTELGGSTLDSLLTGKIVKDSDSVRNKAVALTYQGNTTNDSGPGFVISMVADDISTVRYIPEQSEEDLVISFDIKVENCTASSNFYLRFGSGSDYALNFGGSGNQKIGTRIDASRINYGGTYATITEGAWHTIRLEQHIGETNEDFVCKVYVDNVLKSTNNYYYNYLDGGSPSSGYGKVELVWYRKGAGTIYLDNIKNALK